MHVGSLMLFELPKGYKGDYYEDVKEMIAARMHLCSIFHRKLAQMPFELTDPVWIEGLTDFAAQLPYPVVVDHFAGVNASLGPEDIHYKQLLRLCAQPNVWMKLCGAARMWSVTA